MNRSRAARQASRWSPPTRVPARPSCRRRRRGSCRLAPLPRLRWHVIALGVHRVPRRVGLVTGANVSRPTRSSTLARSIAALGETTEQLGSEVQAGGRRCRRTGLGRIDRLITLRSIEAGGDVRRQRHLAALDRGSAVVRRRAVRPRTCRPPRCGSPTRTASVPSSVTSTSPFVPCAPGGQRLPPWSSSSQRLEQQHLDRSARGPRTRSRAGITRDSLTTSRSPGPAAPGDREHGGSRARRNLGRRAGGRSHEVRSALGDAVDGQVVGEVVEPHGGRLRRPLIDTADPPRAGCATIAVVSTSSTPSRTDKVALDGGTMDLHVWPCPTAPGQAYVLIQEIFGVGEYVRDVAARLAATAYVVAAPDVFWRFAPGWQTGHDQAGLEESIAKSQELDVPQAIADCAAALGLPPVPCPRRHWSGQPCSASAWVAAWRGESPPTAIPTCASATTDRQVPDMLDLIDRGVLSDAVPLRQRRPVYPRRGSRSSRRSHRRSPGLRAQRRERRPRIRQPPAEMFWDESAAKPAWAKTMAFLTEHVADGPGRER